jgi:hypothetical protein
VVLNLLNLGPIGQDEGKVSASTGRVFALTMITDCRPIQNTFEAALEAASCFGCLIPDRFQDFQYEAGINGTYRQVAKNGIGLGLKGACPLVGIFAVFPAQFVRLDVSLGTLPECHGSCIGCPSSQHAGHSVLDGINAVAKKDACLSSHITHRGKANRMQRSQAYISRLAVYGEAIDPRLGAGST